MTPFLFDDPNPENSPYGIIILIIVLLGGTLASLIMSAIAFRKLKLKAAWIVSGIPAIITFIIFIGLPLSIPVLVGEKQFLSEAAPGSKFPDIRFYYHKSWEVSEKPESMNGKIITFSKDGHILKIEQVIYVGGGGCLYEDTPASALDLPAMDFRGQGFKEFTAATGVTRYAPSPYNEDKTKIVYEFCQHVIGEPALVYGTPEYGNISLEVPVSYDDATFKEALEIVSTMNVNP
jgi:hypothetical protein